ncbi:MAG: hypothetical protein ACMXYC_03700 [Candidatus Woesearchaeota archaeon]
MDNLQQLVQPPVNLGQLERSVHQLQEQQGQLSQVIRCERSVPLNACFKAYCALKARMGYRVPTKQTLINGMLQGAQVLNTTTEVAQQQLEEQIEELQKFIDTQIDTRDKERKQFEGYKGLIHGLKPAPSELTKEALAQRRLIRNSLHSFGLSVDRVGYSEREVAYLSQVEELMGEVLYVSQRLGQRSRSLCTTLQRINTAYNAAINVFDASSILYRGLSIIEGQVSEIHSGFHQDLLSVMDVHQRMDACPGVFEQNGLQQSLATMVGSGVGSYENRRRLSD